MFKAFSSFADDDDIIDLCIDNAGGHGSKDAIKEYEGELMRKYKIRLVWQIPRSMEFNMLDLGVWMASQSWVEKCHRGRRSNVDALWYTMEQAWVTLERRVFENVWERWKKVLKIIIADGGDNKLVDAMRGSLYTSIILPKYEAAMKEIEREDAALEDYRDEDDDDDDIHGVGPRLVNIELQDDVPLGEDADFGWSSDDYGDGGDGNDFLA